MIFSMGLVSAVMPMIAIALGKNRHSVRDVRRTVRQGFWTAIMIAIPIWIVLWHCEEIFLFLGQRPDIAARSTDFMHTLQWALLPYLGYIVLRSFFAAMEKPMWTLLIAALAIGFNALAGWTLIFGHFGFPRMELHGAGIATTASSTMMFLGLAFITLRHRRFRRYHLFGRFWRPDWPRLLELWRIGIPMALTFVFETSIFYAAVVMMGRIGPTAMAAHAVAIQIASLSFMVPLGFGQVATVRVGRAYGAGHPKAIAYAGWSAYFLGVGFMAVMGLLMVLIPRLFIGVFLDLHDPQNQPVMELAVTFLALAALFQIVDGAQAVAAGMLRGLRDTRIPMFLALFGYWGVGLPLGALLAFVRTRRCGYLARSRCRSRHRCGVDDIAVAQASRACLGPSGLTKAIRHRVVWLLICNSETYFVSAVMRSSAAPKPFSETLKATGWLGLKAVVVTLILVPALSAATCFASKLTGARQPWGRQVEKARLGPAASSILSAAPFARSRPKGIRKTPSTLPSVLRNSAVRTRWPVCVLLWS